MAEATGQPSVPVLPRNQFRLEEIPIGRGGFGTVFRGEHTKIGLVAVKTLIDTGLLPQKHLRALQREAERLRLVCQHPSILNLHGIITEKDNYSLVLEYMPLGSATDFRKDFTVQWPLIIQILRDVIDGMTFLHGHDPTILHLDLKADNILLDKGLRAKISDFGLSEWKTITMTVTRGGGGQSSARRCTVTHVPPEVWSNVNLPSDRYYDIYSFGIIIWELLSGETPYKSASEELVRSSVLSGQRPDFIQIPKDCPMFLTKMMTRCWHQKPTQRPEFKGLKPEIEGEFESNYRKNIVKSLKKVRQEITRMYPTTDPIYIYTNEIDSMVEPVDEQVPSTSLPMATMETRLKVIDEVLPPKQPEPPKEEETIPKVLFKAKEDLTTEDKEVRKVLFSPTACRLAKTRYFREIFKITEDTRQTLLDPAKRRKYIEADETLAQQVKYSKHNAFYELDGEFYEFRTSVGQQWTEVTEKDISDRQRRSYTKERGYGSYNTEEKDTERGLKHRRATQSLEKNPAMKKLKSGGAYYKVKKILENPDMLKQSLEDKRKGVDNSLRLIAIDSETLPLVQNPFLLMMVFGNEYDIKRKYKENHEGLFMELFANANYKDDFPSGGYQLPNDIKDIIPHWLEEEMTKAGFDVNRMTQMQEMERRRRQFNYGRMHHHYGDDDDDDYDDYSPMRHLSQRMMGVNMKPGMRLSEKMDGYQTRRMLSDVESKSSNKAELAKKIISILCRPPMEAQSSSMPQHPLDMLVQMGGNISMAEMGYRSSNRANRLSEERKIMQMLKMAEQKQKEQSSSRKSGSTRSHSQPSSTVIQKDLDALASITSMSSKPSDPGKTKPSDPKKSKSDLETDAVGSSGDSSTRQSDTKSSTSESKIKQTSNKDGTVEIEHKGTFGGLTRLFFGKSAKVPNLQVGDHNMMKIGGHFEDSEDDDDVYMSDGSYDKSYKPPGVSRPPTKEEIDKIADRISGDYRNLGRHLKIPNNNVEQIIEDYRKEGIHEITYQVIRRWQQLNGREATNIVLSNTLHKMRRDDLSAYLRC